MAVDLQQRIDSIRTKAEIITSRYSKLMEEKRAVDERVADLQRTVEMQQRRIAELNSKVEYLTVVTTLTPGRQQVEQTRAMLTELVREIDQCITDLKH